MGNTDVAQYQNIATTDRMSGVPYSIKFFVYEKLEVQKCSQTDISERWHSRRIAHAVRNIEHCSQAASGSVD